MPTAAEIHAKARAAFSRKGKYIGRMYYYPFGVYDLSTMSRLLPRLRKLTYPARYEKGPRYGEYTIWIAESRRSRRLDERIPEPEACGDALIRMKEMEYEMMSDARGTPEWEGAKRPRRRRCR